MSVATVRQTRHGKYIEVVYQSSRNNWAEALSAAYKELGEGFKHLPVIAVTPRLKEALDGRGS